MSAWKKLSEILKEERRFRGDSFVPYNELLRLFVGRPGERDGITGVPPDKNGGMVVGAYRFDPSILALGDSSHGDIMAWHDDIDVAIARAVTDSVKQISGVSQGGTMVKKNYGGRVMMQRAPVSPHYNDRIPSTYDRYDVVIEADIDWVLNRKGTLAPVGIIRKIAWAPSMGSAQERAERLQSLMAGRSIKLPRRPQPDLPVPPATISSRRDDDSEGDA
jgi:hypothetical protein